MSDIADLDIFTDLSLVNDPFPYFEALRTRGPVTRTPHHNVVAVVGYDEASEVWRDSERFSSCASVTGPLPGLPFDVAGHSDITELIEQHRDVVPMGEYLVTADPPTHTQLRGLLMRLLTPKRLQENEAFIERLAAQMVDDVVAQGRFEILRGFAQPFAMFVIADLLGVPEEDHREFSRQLGVDASNGMVGGVATTLDPLAFLNNYFSTYVEDRRKAPRNDVLTHLATATYPDGSTPEVIDVVRTATFLFAAGQDTTARLITAAMLALAEHPEVQDRVRNDLELVPNFVEEMLRLEGPVKSVARVAKVDTVVGGVETPAGTIVNIFPHAANRDPRRFDDPDAVQPDRPSAKEHLAFGRGIHSCPGGPLARVEARIALTRFLERTSSIRLDEEHHGPPGARRDLDHEPTYILRGVKRLHLEVTPA